MENRRYDPNRRTWEVLPKVLKRGLPSRTMSAYHSRTARGVYEADCTGFVPARLLTSDDVEVVPIAPSKKPTSPESRTRKNDRNDAARLARLELAGELRGVWVPSEEVEGLRDLANALDDLKDQRERAFRRCEALLCRHGVVWDARSSHVRDVSAGAFK